jgi:Immunity protein 50
MTEELPSPDVLNSIPGGPELLAWFGGYVPSFHDAEIIDLHLNRTGASTLRIHAWEMDPDHRTEEWPPFTKHVIVTFVLEGIIGLDLEDFSPQNVIMGLEVRRGTDETHSFGMSWLDKPPAPPEFYEIDLVPIYGLAGTIRARRVSIQLTPGKPSDSFC